LAGSIALSSGSSLYTTRGSIPSMIKRRG
jgi:hypothetical protein